MLNMLAEFITRTKSIYWPKIVLCSLIKNEQIYLEEWIKYNIKLGFTSIYLVEDFDSLSHESIVKKYK